MAQGCPTLCDPMDCSTPGFPVHHQLPELAQTHAHQVGDTIQSSHPLSTPSPPRLQSFPASRSFLMSQFLAPSGQNIGASVSASVLPMNIQDWFPLGLTGFITLLSKGLSRVFSEYSGLISFRIDWFDHLAVQGTLKSLLQHHSSKASIIRCSAFFMVQLSHPYTSTGKKHSFD